MSKTGPQRVAVAPVSAEGQSKVKVLVRIRPILANESNVGTPVLQIDEENTGNLILNDFRRPDGALQYSFDHCYTASTNQEDIFKQEIEPSLPNLMKGLNTTIFCVGMTGAGKTHTMQGSREDPGIIPRAVKSVLDLAAAVPTTAGAQSSNTTAGHGSKLAQPRTGELGCSVSMSYFEIYNEKVYDLLEPKDSECAVREDVNHKVIVANLKEAPVAALSDFTTLFETGLRNRKTAATKLNHVSSRSHALLMLKVRTRDAKKSYEAKLYLIDLAGNEDNRKTDNRGMRMTESVNINSSLLALAKVVQALNEGEKRIPYRESKLTRLLQDSLGGTSVGIMIANVAPGFNNFLNTYNTLNFASKSRQVINSVVANTQVLETTSSDDRRRQLDAWKETKSRSTMSLQPSSAASPIGASHADYSAASPTASSSELRSELDQLKREHQTYKEQKQAQAKINESYLARIAQLEKALIEKKGPTTSTTTSSIPTVIPKNIAPVAAAQTPCTKTKNIHAKISRAKNMEVLDPNDALRLYSEVLSELQLQGSDYREVLVKVQARIDKLLAQCMDAQDKTFSSAAPSSSAAPTTSKLQKKPSVPTFSAPSSVSITSRDRTKAPSNSSATASASTLPRSTAPTTSSTSVVPKTNVSRALFTEQENVQPNKTSEKSANLKKRKSMDSSVEEDESGDEEFEMKVDETDSDMEIVETPVKRPAKKRKLLRVSESESEEVKTRNIIAQELEVLDAPAQQELDNILQILNSGDVKAIKNLHGIGKVRAEQIAERSKTTPFTALEQLIHAGFGAGFIVTFVKRNIVEAVYFKKTASAPGASYNKPATSLLINAE